MDNLAQYAAALAPAQLKMPDNARFSIDGDRIAQRSTAMAAELPRADPAVILNISRIPEALSSANEFAKTYQR